DSTQAPAIYRGRAWPKPTGKLLSFSDAYVQDSLQPVYWLGEQKTYANLGGVTVTLDPQQLGRQYLERADVIVLQAVKAQLGRRWRTRGCCSPTRCSRTRATGTSRRPIVDRLSHHQGAGALWNGCVTRTATARPFRWAGLYCNSFSAFRTTSVQAEAVSSTTRIWHGSSLPVRSITSSRTVLASVCLRESGTR